jgi:hypothetical protein
MIYKIGEVDEHRMDMWHNYGYWFYVPVLDKKYAYYWRLNKSFANN